MIHGADLAVYETFEDNFGRKSTLEELEQELGQFSLSSLLWTCAVVATGAQLWDRKDPPLDVYSSLLNLFFPPSLVTQFQIGFWSKDPRTEVFHRRQILLIAKLGILHCKAHGIDLRQNAERFGSILLKANDQFHHGILPKPDEDIPDKEKFLRLIVELVAVTEYGKPNIRHQLGRNQLLLGDYVNKLCADTDFVDVAREFEDSTGISIEENTAMLFGLHARYGRNLAEMIKTDPGALPFSIHTFAQTPIPISKREKFIHTISEKPARIKAELLKRDYGANDFTIFRKFPAVEQWYNPHLKNFCFRYLLLDNHMLIDKQISGPYWCALRNHEQRFTRFWGRVFEEYISDLLANACSKTVARFVPDIRHPDKQNEQICDGLVIDGTRLVVIETKAALFRADAKYSGDCRLLEEEIDSKLVREKDTGQKKAALQLADAVAALTGDPNILLGLGVDISAISEIYPLVVTLDSIGGTVGISSYLNLAFQQALEADPKFRPIIRPLGCVDVECLEYMSEFMRAASMPELLRRWHEFNPPLAMPFVAIPIEGIAREQNPWLKTTSEERFKSAIRILFPDKDPDLALKEVAQKANKMA